MKLQAMHYYTLGLGLIALLLVATLLVVLTSSRKIAPVSTQTIQNTVRANPETENTARAIVQITPEPDNNEAVQQVRIGN